MQPIHGIPEMSLDAWVLIPSQNENKMASEFAVLRAVSFPCELYHSLLMSVKCYRRCASEH